MEFAQHMQEYKRLLQTTNVQQAYRGLMEYVQGLRNHLARNYPHHSVSGAIYQGVMDMTYFAFTSKPLKDRKLKVGICFNHDAFCFELWLFGQNMGIQTQYHKIIKDGGFSKYTIADSPQSFFYLVNHVLVADPDFSDTDALTKQIESGVLAFTEDVEGFLTRH